MYNLSFLLYILILILLSSSYPTTLFPTRLIYESPVGISFENLAVRPNGSILITSDTAPLLYLVNPFEPNPQPTLVQNFTEKDVNITTGITETTPDTFYVTALRLDLSNLKPTPGSNHLFRVHYPLGNNTQPEISLAATVTEAGWLNGLTTLNPSTVLAADSSKGVVWAINVFTGTYKIVIQDPLMAVPTTRPLPLGVNGVRHHVDKRTLFFTNSGQGLLAKIEINADGTPVGPPATIITKTSTTLPNFDDFASSPFGDAIFATTASGNTIAEVSRGGREQRVIAGDLNSTEIAEPTSAQFGRTEKDWGTLYVTTAGGLLIPVNGDEVVGAQLVAIDVFPKRPGASGGYRNDSRKYIA